MSKNTPGHDWVLSVPVKVGKLFNVTINPEKAVVNQPVQVDIRNEFGLEADGAKIWVTNKYGILYKFGDIQKNEIFSFSPDLPTLFFINVTAKEEEGYCDYVKVIEARHNMTVFGPYSDRYPDEPIVGDEILIRLQDEAGEPVPGATITVSGPEKIDLNTERRGSAAFTANNAGEHYITIEKSTPLYWSVNKTLYVHAKPTIKVTVSPETPSLGKEVKLKILTENVSGANITLTNPEGFVRVIRLSENNEAVFSVTSPGTYTVNVSHECCTGFTKNIEVYSSLKILIDPKKPAVGEDVTVTVVDQDGYAVPNAALTVRGKEEFTETTNQNGELKFKLTSREYAITAEKKDYKKASSEIAAYVRELSLSLNTPSVRIYEGDIHISLTEKDTKTPVPAKITITGERTGAITADNASEFVFKPEFADSYMVSVAKEYYEGSSESFVVEPVPLEIGTSLDEKNLTIRVTSEDKPLPSVDVSILTPNGKLNRITDDNGIVVVNLDIEGEGDYSIFSSNPPNYNSAEAAVKVIRNQQYWWAWLILIIILAAGVIMRRF
jgi:hypothetical protein